MYHATMKRLKFFLLLFLLIGCAPPNDPQPPPATVTQPALTLVAATEAPAVVTPPAPATAVPEPSPTAIPQPTATAVPTTFCSDIPRPALVVAAGDALALTHPQTGASCPLPVAATGAVQLRENGLYYLNEDKTAVLRHALSGQTTPLPFSKPPAGSFINSFVLSPDGSRIAWTAVRGEADGSSHSQLTIANSNGQERMDFPEIVLPDGRFVELVRIGYDNHQLFLAYQPAAVAALEERNGRYDSLYTTCCGGFPQKMLDCTDLGLSFCIGDLSPDGQQVAYIADETITVADADGVIRATIPAPRAFVGYPTFNLAGDLFFYAAAEPSAATIYRVPFPYSEAAQPIAAAAGLLPPLQWLGDTQLVTGWQDGAGQAAHALADLTNGSVIPLPPGEPLAILAPLTVPMVVHTELSPNGRWQVRYGESIAVAASSDELETFPGGAKYAVLLEVAEVGGTLHHTVVDEWRGAGLGQEWPVPYRWSADGQSLYITDNAAVDGCGTFINGTHLNKVDLASGNITELLPRHRTLNVALSLDEQWLAFTSNSPEGELLVIREVASGAEQSLLLDAAPDAQAGHVVWSPDGQGLLVSVVHAPCSQQTRYSLLHFNRATNTLTPVASQEPTPTYVQAWPSPPRVRLNNDSGASWFFDVATGEKSPTERMDGLCAGRAEIGWFFAPAPATCPLDVVAASPALAQRFEHGQMVWQEAARLVTVLFDDGDYALFSLPPELAANEGGLDLMPPEGFLPPSGPLTAVWRGQLPLSETVGERLGWATTPAVRYTALQQLDISSAPLTSGPQFVLPPDVAYLSLAGGQVVGLANGRYFSAGYLLEPTCFYPPDVAMVGAMLVMSPTPCLVWQDSHDDETGFRVEMMFADSGVTWVEERPFDTTHLLLPPAIAQQFGNTAGQCDLQQAVELKVTALKPGGNRLVMQGNGFLECMPALGS